MKVKFDTNLEGLKETAPIQPAIKFIPEWFKRMPMQYMEKLSNVGQGVGASMSSTKLCPGMIEYFKQGYVVPLWADLLIDISRTDNELKYAWEFSDKTYKLDHHLHSQFLDYAPKHAQQNIHMIFKLINPWRVKLPKGYSMYQLPMHYHYDDNFHVLPGIYPSDSYPELHSQLCITKLGQFVIERGTPIAHYVPFKRESFTLEITHNNKEMNKFCNISARKIDSKFKKRWRNIDV